MAWNIRPRRPSETSMFVDDVSEYDSDISLTSTVNEVHDSDQEFEVEDVRAEDIFDGETRFLVKWTNFPIDECTWEPEENLSNELREQWEETKIKQQRGELPKFEVETFYRALNKKRNESHNRHQRRNAKRKRLGLPLTKFTFRGVTDTESESGSLGGLDDEASGESDDEAAKDSSFDYRDIDVLPSKPKSAQPHRPNPIFKTMPVHLNTTEMKKAPTKSAKDERSFSLSKSTGTGASKTTLQVNPTSRQHPEPPSITGYQGTARRPSASVTQARVPYLSSNLLRGNLPATTKLAGNSPTKPAGNAPVRKGFTAKKSDQASQAATNVFSGGKQRKARQKFEDAMSDITKNPRLFGQHRMRRKAELKSRGREDQAPDLAAIDGLVFSIKKGPQQKPSLKSGQAEPYRKRNPPGEHEEFIQSEDIESKSLLVKSNSLNTTENERPRKKSKSVRFTGEDGAALFDEPMNIDTSVPTSRFPRSPTPPAAATPRPKKRLISITDYQSRNLHSVGKNVVLGSDPTKVINMTFSGVPREAGDQPWLRNFLDTATIITGHTCFGRTMSSQLDMLRHEDPPNLHLLCGGFITSATDNHLLEIVADHLRSGLSVLCFAHDLYNIIIHPTKCDEFKIDIPGTDPSSPDGITLKYFIFSTTHEIGRLLRPIKPVDMLPTSEDPGIGPGKERAYLFQKLLEIRYDKLIAVPSAQNEHYFFLAFPQSKLDVLKSICAWLQSCNTACHIFVSRDPGSWSAFQEKSRSQSGTIIIHDAAVSLVRRIPSLAMLLQTSLNYNFWCFSESVEMQPISPRTTSGINHTDPGSSIFSRMFPQGQAIFVTPSFMVSEPQKTLELFYWFVEYKASTSSNKLVTAYDIVAYFRDLAAEKTAKREELRRTRWKTLGLAETLEENMACLTEEDILARQKTWMYAHKWFASQVERNGPLSEDNFVIYAPESIDPNDEQSLVNWFGWWSTTRLDQYRKFCVVGSKNSSHISANVERVPSRMSLVLEIPKYPQSTVVDPDEALRSALQNYQGGTENATNSVPNMPISPDATAGSGAQVPTRPAGWFQSQVLENDDSRLTNLLRELDHVAGNGHVRLYGFPVSWTDMDMADHFGDHTAMCRRLCDWFKWSYAWLQDRPMKCFNTYVGLFYTIEGDWDPEAYPRGRKPKRHVWLAVYRPVNVHDRSTGYKKTELIIWDVTAKDKFTDPYKTRIAETDLIWMQRQLIEFIRHHGHEKNAGSTLDRVYLGGFQLPPNAPGGSTLPVDITLNYLKTLMANLKYTLPSAERYLLSNGFFKVHKEKVSTRPRNLMSPSSATGVGEPMDHDHKTASTKEDDIADERIVFHPPRGSGIQTQSKCTNHLFECARLARLHNKNAKTMEFTFRSTMDWYGDQLYEDRGFQHILVDQWESIFKQLDVKTVPIVNTGSGSSDANRTFGGFWKDSAVGSKASSHST